MAKAAPLPKGFNWVTPYLTVRDCAAAIAFYEKAYGFEKREAIPGPGGMIMHAEMMHQDSMIMMGQSPQMGTKAPQGTPPVSLYVYVEDVDALCKRAAAAGAKVKEQPVDKFYGDRVCLLNDPDGHYWYFATHVKDVSPEEMADAAKAMAGAKK